MFISSHDTVLDKWECVSRHICKRCGKKIEFFLEKSSLDYYNKTGLCQECQELEFESKRTRNNY